MYEDLHLRLPQLSPHPVDMALEVAASDKFRQNVLLEDGNGAGIKTDSFLQGFGKFGRKDHITGAHGRCDGTGKSVHINHGAAGLKRKDGIFRFCGHSKFGVHVILNDHGTALPGPSDVFTPLGGVCGDA